MDEFQRIIDANRRWVAEMIEQDPDYFSRLAKGQQPNYLFIGCSDSRVPANAVTGTGSGELFVHRNIANQVFPADLNVLSVLQYAVEVLDVKHVIVCGHYGCGGVRAAMGEAKNGLVDYWLGGIRNLLRAHEEELAALPDEHARMHRVVELNVIAQVFNLTQTPVISDAWGRGRRPLLHGLVYALDDGILHELVVGLSSHEDTRRLYEEGDHLRTGMFPALGEAAKALRG